MNQLTIYCAKPMTGYKIYDVWKYYTKLEKVLTAHHYKVLHPLIARPLPELKQKQTAHMVFKPEYPADSIRCSHAIVERDRWMVKQSDILYTNLCKASVVSIGCISELAWAHDAGKHTVVAMEPGNPHWHAFTLDMADILFSNEAEALKYLFNFGESINR